MAEYIEREALMDAFRGYMVEQYDREKCVSEENCKTCERGCLWRKIVNNAPTIEAEPVKHGRWVDRYGGKYANPLYECSECKEAALYGHRMDSLGRYYTVQVLSTRCPNCGAKMDLKGGE